MARQTIHGVDISRWQSGPFDWKAARKAGVQFVYHKVTEAMSYDSAYIDLYHDRRGAVEAAGIAYGGYHFAQPKLGQGRAEAAYFLRHLKYRKGDLRPCLDLEDTGGLSRAALTMWVGDFVREVVRQTGVKPIIYLSRQIPLDDAFGCLLWVPRYSNSNMSPHPLPAPFKEFAVWQFSNGVYGDPKHVPGVGNVDINTFGKGFDLSDLVPTKKEQPMKVQGTKDTPTANMLTKALAGEVGYREGYNNTNKYAALAGHLNNQPWCATFLEGMSNKVGLRDLIPSGQSMASCDLMFAHFQKKGRWSEYPAVGAFFFLGKSGSGSVVNGKRVDLYHVGYVYAYDENNIYTIEGNTNDDGSSNGNGVYARVRPRRNSSVHVYAYPEFKEGLLSADPKWKDRGPKPDKDDDVTPPSSSQSEKLYVMHVSMQFGDPTAQMTHDVDKIFAHAVAKKAAWITGTEAARGDTLKALLAKASRENGYRFYMDRGNDSWIAVRNDLIKGKKWETFYKKVIDGKAGQYGDKGVMSVTFDTHELGEISVMAGHYLTKGRPTPNPDHNFRLEENKAYAAAINDRAKVLAKGSAIVFYGGDQNIDDRKYDTFFGGNFLSTMDELKKWENTGHGPIDVIASWRGNKRVKALRVRAYPDRAFFLHTDHFMVDATFEVQKVKQPVKK